MLAVSVYKAEHLGIPVSEVLRYMGVRAAADEKTAVLAAEAVADMEKCARGAACFLRLPVTAEGDGTLQIGPLRMPGAALERHLRGCREAYLFAATAGMDCERAIVSAARLSPCRAVALDAAGSAAIESFCDALCTHFEALCGEKLRYRFSPGYGDLPIGLQSGILSLLDAPRKIGLTISAGGMLLPVKSVTAVVGIGGKE